MLCMRWVVSIAGTCEIGLAEVVEDHPARAIAQLQCHIFSAARIRAHRGEDVDFDPAASGQASTR